MPFAVVAFRAAAGVADDRLLAPRAHLGELGVLLDLEPPALVLGEVPVECVELERGEEIDVPLDEFYREEVAPDIEMQSPIAKARRIVDARCGDGRRRRRDELPQGLD